MKTNLVHAIGVLSLVVAAACSSTTEPAAPVREVPRFTCLSNSATMRIPADLRATLPTFGPRSPDDRYVMLSQSAPGGFAGLFWDNNHYVLTFVDPATANQARAEVDRQVVADHVLAADAQAKAEIRGGVRWTFAELDEWYRYIIPQIHGPGSGISSTDIDEFANTIAFGVIDEASRAKLETQLASLGVSCNLVTTVIQPYAVLAKG